MTESSSSEETAPSKAPKDLLGLGVHLVRELGLRDSTDTMGRWLAHYLAELMTEAANRKKSVAHRVEAQKQAADLILKIWERRNLLPGNAYPLAPYKEILKVLGLLRLEGNPWRRRSGTPYQILAASIYDRLCRLVIGLLLIDVAQLLHRRTGKRNKSLKFLADEEREILKELERWSEAVSNGELPATDKSESRQIDVRVPLQKLADAAIKQLHELQQRLLGDLAASSATEKRPKKSSRKSRQE
jgi:hypothetical protein